MRTQNDYDVGADFINLEQRARAARSEYIGQLLSNGVSTFMRGLRSIAAAGERKSRDYAMPPLRQHRS